MDEQHLSKMEKILLALHQLSAGSTRGIKFEDIVVKVFERYPEEFHLRGYVQFPDSGDTVHKPLYEAKKKGLVNAGNKIFSLTDRGVEVVAEMATAISGKRIRSTTRLSRYAESEVERISQLESFASLYLQGNTDKILDTDFYNYLGVTVRTLKNDFNGRLNTVNAVIKELKALPKNQMSATYRKIIEFHDFMLKKFREELAYKTNN